MFFTSKLFKYLPVILASVTFFVVGIPKVLASTINVDDGTSTVATDGFCSLREAIQNANDNAATNTDCVAGSGTDTINLQVDVNLDTVDHSGVADFAVPSPTEALVIEGNNHNLSRIGSIDFQFLDKPEDLTLQNMTVSNFSVNSGSSNSGLIDCGDATCALTFSNVIFSNNLGGIVDSSISSGTGAWVIDGCSFTNNTGGGILHSGFPRDVTISDSSFISNLSTDGVDGGAFTYTGGTAQTILITNSVFQDNTNVSGFGASIGISTIAGGSATITGSTFKSESAGGGGGSLSIESLVSAINVDIEDSLFDSNQSSGVFGGGAIYLQSSVSLTLKNNTFYGNVATAGNGGVIIVGEVNPAVSINANYNTFYNNSASTGVGNDIYQLNTESVNSVFENNIFSGTSDDCAGDLTNFTFTNNLSGDSDCGATTSANNIDDSLQTNNGQTKTLAILSGSNAIDQGTNATLGCPATDQRGESRPKGNACDIGAYESVPANNNSGGGGGGSTGSSGPSNPVEPETPVTPDVPEEPPVEEPVEPIIPTPPEEPVEPETPVTPDVIPNEQDDIPIPDVNPSPSDSPIIPDENFVTDKIGKDIALAIKDTIAVIPQKTAEAVSLVGVAVPTIVAIVTQPTVAINIVSIPIRLWNLIPIWLGFKRKKRPWGTVYDSITKQPLDPVYVTLMDLRGKEIATTITDIDGRFGFLVSPGRYKITARKDNYEFPSRKLLGVTKDELYDNLYFEDEIQISGEEDLVIRNIPMDSISFNWNEFEKAKNKQLMKFYSKRELFLARIANILFWVGLIISAGLMFGSPTKLNYILFGVYAFVLILRSLGIKPKKPGYVTEKETGFPLSFGIVKIFSEALNREIAHAIVSKTGKYYCLVPNGNYYMTISKKTGEDSYTEVYKSPNFRVRKGYVGRGVKV